MSEKYKIFLESHNIANLYSGFGQFNYWLIKNLVKHNPGFEFTAYAKNKAAIRDLKNRVKFKKYYSFNRYPSFRLRKKYDLWHALNQNSKIEPHSSMPYLMTLHDVIFLEKDEIEQVNKEKIKLLKEKIDRCSAIVYISEHAKSPPTIILKFPSQPPNP